jgi:TfoX/Sxy family transcriptional regulator of competence genes
LAYLDLTLVAEFEKKSITGAKKIELIYPADQRLIAKPYDKLEKATDKSKWLMKESTINAIKAQIRKESRYHKYK